MAKVLSDIQAEVRTYLDEATQGDWKDSEVTTAINRSYLRVCQKVMEVYDAWFETTTPFTYAVIATQQEYTIDPTLIKVTRVEINYTPNQVNSTATRAFPLKKDEIRGNLGNTNNAGSSFRPGYYLHGNIGAQKVGFVPVPTVADTTGKSISVWGIALPSDLTGASDNVNIPWADNFAYLISLRAAVQLLRKGQQEETAASRYRAEYEEGLVDMITFLKDRQSDDMQGIIDSELEQIDFSTTQTI